VQKKEYVTNVFTIFFNILNKMFLWGGGGGMIGVVQYVII